MSEGPGLRPDAFEAAFCVVVGVGVLSSRDVYATGQLFQRGARPTPREMTGHDHRHDASAIGQPKSMKPKRKSARARVQNKQIREQEIQ